MKVDIFNTNKKYSIIYADPPWAYAWGKGKNGGNFAPEKHYKTMSVDEICKMKSVIKKITDKKCALFMWTTMPCLPDAVRLIKEWGFKYKTCAFTWVKVKKD
ncbi:MAG: DNA methyltransferase, partial [Clostridia bacterium]|nr:DNA methyltransferase [Clostridia bacterium]